jgi:hypothetical protein
LAFVKVYVFIAPCRVSAVKDLTLEVKSPPALDPVDVMAVPAGLIQVGFKGRFWPGTMREVGNVPSFSAKGTVVPAGALAKRLALVRLFCTVMFTTSPSLAVNIGPGTVGPVQLVNVLSQLEYPHIMIFSFGSWGIVL